MTYNYKETLITNIKRDGKRTVNPRASSISTKAGGLKIFINTQNVRTLLVEEERKKKFKNHLYFFNVINILTILLS